MNWLFVISIIVLAILITCIFIALRSMNSVDDERGLYIKNKAMIFTFKISIAIQVLHIMERIIFVLRDNFSQYEAPNPIISLIITSIIYLTSLLYERRKHGG